MAVKFIGYANYFKFNYKVFLSILLVLVFNHYSFSQYNVLWGRTTPVGGHIEIGRNKEIICSGSIQGLTNAYLKAFKLDSNSFDLWLYNQEIDGGYCVGLNYIEENNEYVFLTQLGNGTFLDYLLTKLDSSGNVIFNRRFKHPTGDNFAYALHSVSDVGFLILTSADGGPSYIGSGLDYSTIKLLENGDYVLTKTYSPGNSNDYASDIKPMKDGSFVIAGSKHNLESHTYLLKVRGNGDTILSKNYVFFDSSMDEFPYRIEETPDRGLIIIGSFDNTYASTLKAFIVKVDSNYNVEWKTSYESIIGVSFADVKVMQDSSFLVAANQYGYVKDEILKIDKNGYIIDTFILNVCLNGSFGEIESLNNGTLIISGSCDSGVGDTGYLFKLGNTGNPYIYEYCKVLPTADFTWKYEGNKIHFTDKSETHLKYDDIFDYKWDFGNGATSRLKDPYVVYYGQEGDSIDVNVRLIVTSNLGCKDTITKTVRVRTVRDIAGTFQIFPNPYHDFATVRIKTKKIAEGGEFVLYDLLGRAIRTYTIPSLPNQEFYEFTIDRQNMASEMYIYKLRIGDEVNIGKIVIQ